MRHRLRRASPRNLGARSVTAGQTATFSVAATGTAPLSYQWQKNGVNVGANSSSYTTAAATTSDNGASFTVTITNSAGNIKSAAAILTVNAAPVAPSITTQPGSQSVTAGQTATFSVAATGTAPLSYQWQKNGVNVGTNSSSYTAAATTSDNGASFTVTITNSAGNIKSAAAILTVNAAPVAPSITTQPGSQSVTAGQTATFSVAATGTAPLSYQWQKNGVNVGTNSSSYTTAAATTSDNGASFTVTITNSAGNMKSAAAILTVTTAVTYTISGSISGAGGNGATVTLSGAASASTTANSSGNYTFSGLANGTYAVTPAQTGYTFSPSSQAATINGANVTGVNFTATSVGTTYTISGTISPSAGGSGATVTLSGAAGATTTANSSGVYSFTALGNGSYTVTPSNSGYSYTPTNQAVTINGASVSGVNFTASASATVIFYDDFQTDTELSSSLVCIECVFGCEQRRRVLSPFASRYRAGHGPCRNGHRAIYKLQWSHVALHFRGDSYGTALHVSLWNS